MLVVGGWEDGWLVWPSQATLLDASLLDCAHLSSPTRDTTVDKDCYSRVPKIALNKRIGVLDLIGKFRSSWNVILYI